MKSPFVPVEADTFRIQCKCVHRIHNLGQIVLRLRLSGLSLNCLERREEQADQDRDNGDDDEQLDEREGAACVAGGRMGRMLNGS